MFTEPKATKDAKYSQGELERRRKAVREAMKEKGLEALLLIVPGNIRWLTDMGSALGSVLIFPGNGEMQLVTSGPREPLEPVPLPPPGFKRPLSTPLNPVLEYTTEALGELLVEALKDYKNSRIGIAGMKFMNVGSYSYLTQHLPGAKFENATDLVDSLKARKSDEEMALIREGCRLADAMFEYSLTLMQPGRMVYEVIADVVRKWTDWVSELPINIMMGATPEGTPATWSLGPKRFRKLENGDQMTYMIEALAPGGIWVELARPICIGKIPSELAEMHGLAREAQKMLLGMVKPGVNPRALWDANNEFLKKHGYQKETRILGHSLGYDMVERPCLTFGETMPFPTRLHFSIHPTVHNARVHAWICDEYFLDESGNIEHLNKTPEKIFVV